MKHIIQIALILSSPLLFAGNTTPESISKEYLKNEMNRMPIVRKMRAAETPKEKAEYKAELQKVWDFSNHFIDKERVQRNSSQAYHMGHFANSVRTWAEENGMNYQKLLVRTKVKEKTDDYASIVLFVEHNQCMLEFYNIEGNWKITKEQCVYKHKR